MRLVFVSVSWIVGVYLGSLVSLPLYLLLLISSAALILALSFRRKKVILWAALCLVVLMLGIACFAWRTGPPSVVSLNDRGPLTVKGQVIQDPRFHDRTASLSLSIQQAFIEGGWERIAGKIIVETEVVPTYTLGDSLELNGELQSLSGIPDEGYRTYLAAHGFSSRMVYPEVRHVDTGQLFGVRNRLADSVSSTLAEPEASVAKALLLGIRSQIPESLTEDFYRSGTTHILAISGFNVAVIGGLVLALAALSFGRRRPTYLVLTLVIVWLYALLTGMQPPVFRAAIMFSLFIVALSLGRPDSAAASLAFAAAIMVGLSPLVLWDVSFQLSYASVAGLAVIFPPVHRRGEMVADRIQSPLSTPFKYVFDGFAVSFAAIVATLPIVLYHFGATSVLALPATLFASLFLPGAIMLTLTTAMVGLLSSPLASILGWTAWLFLSGMTAAVHGFGSLRYAVVETGCPGVVGVCAYYAVLSGIMGRQRLGTLLSHVGPWLRRCLHGLASLAGGPRLKWTLAALVVVSSLVWLAVVSIPAGDRLEVHFFDVGYGDSILIETPAGQQILIDGGPEPNGACTQLGQNLPFWDKSLDLVVLTHPHDDHLVGLLEVLRRYQVDHVLESGYAEESPAYREWCRLIDEQGVDRILASRDQKIDLGQGIALEIIHPPVDLIVGTEQDANNNSVTLRLVWKNVSFLFTGDLCSEGEGNIIHQAQSHEVASTVLKVPHHGSNGSTSARFLGTVDPDVAVICVGTGNVFGHPGAELLARLGDIPVYRTDLQGSISFLTDGERLWVEV